jgi:ankyrin repeat protein
MNLYLLNSGWAHLDITTIGWVKPLSLTLSPLRGARELANRMVVVPKCAHSRFGRSFMTCCGLLFGGLVWCGVAFGGEIHSAAMAGDLEKVKMLVKTDPELVLSKDKQGLTPLHWAAQNGPTEMVEFLLAHKADVNAKGDRGTTPLHMAQALGHLDTVKLLLANNAEVNARDNYGRTPLFVAAASGPSVEDTNEEKVGGALYGGSGIIEEDPATRQASFAAHKEEVALLLAHHADVNAKDNTGRTALHGAAVLGLTNTAELLLANKAEASAKDNCGITPLHQAAEFGHKDMVALLLANKAEVNAADNRGLTPMHNAALAGQKEVAKLLLANKADINAKDESGRTPLHWAISNGYTNTVMFLLANHADVYAKDNNGQTPLDTAARNGRKDAVELLRAWMAEMKRLY